MRIVSLVPSLTELLIDLGLDEQLVGRTKFCIHPHHKTKAIPKIGGTKNVNIQAVKALKPDLIIANKEENTREDVESLKSFADVHITDITNYEDALLAIKDIGQITDRLKKAHSLIKKIESKFLSISEKTTPSKTVCYLIWNDPLMTIGQDTFIHSMLDKCGFENIFGHEKRYPTVKAEDIIDKKPDYIFLSSEPFPFKDKHIEAYQKMFPGAKIILVDGEYFSWYGSRMVEAASYFNQLVFNLHFPRP